MTNKPVDWEKLLEAITSSESEGNQDRERANDLLVNIKYQQIPLLMDLCKSKPKILNIFREELLAILQTVNTFAADKSNQDIYRRWEGETDGNLLSAVQKLKEAIMTLLTLLNSTKFTVFSAQWQENAIKTGEPIDSLCRPTIATWLNPNQTDRYAAELGDYISVKGRIMRAMKGGASDKLYQEAKEAMNNVQESLDEVFLKSSAKESDSETPKADPDKVNEAWESFRKILKNKGF